MQPRLIGHGPATIWFDDASLVLQGSVDQMRRKGLPATLQAENQFLDVVLQTADGSLRVTDRRSGHRWTQWPQNPIIALDAKTVDAGFHLTLLDPATMLRMEATIRLDPQRPEVACGVIRHGGNFPRGSLPAAADDRQGHLSHSAAERGHQLSGGATRPSSRRTTISTAATACAWPGTGRPTARQGVMTIVETPDDAGVRHARGMTACSRSRRSGSRRGGSSAMPGGSARCSSTTAATWPWPSATAQHAQADRAAQDACRETDRQSQRRPARRRGQRLVLGQGRGGASAARCRRPASAASCGATRADPETLRKLNAMPACSPAATTSTRT